MLWRVGVKIAKSNGIFFRLGDVQSSSTITFEEHFLTYPDKNVKDFILYGRNTTADPWSYKTFEASPSSSANLSWVNVGGSLSVSNLTDGTITDAALTNLPQLNDRDGNRVLVSEVYKPRALYGRRAHSVGDGYNDAVLRFAVNALEISQGQFGQYPAFAFCQRSRFALEVGGDGVAFSAVTPHEVTRGIIGRNGSANVGRIICYLAADGLWTIPESDRPLSYLIQDSTFEADLINNINSATGITYYQHAGMGREELWIATPNRTYAYSLKHAAWFTIDILRARFIGVMGRTLGIGTDGKLYDESGTPL